ncbi:hypothetical protein GEMRC1_007540 [Eukaryota sp. GEM-RC1]
MKSETFSFKTRLPAPISLSMDNPVDLPTIKTMLLEEVLPLYEDVKPDLNKVSALKELHKTSTTISQQRQHDAKKLITSLETDIQNFQSQLSITSNEGNNSTISSLRTQLEQLTKEHSSLQKRRQELQHAIKEKIDFHQVIQSQEEQKRQEAENNAVPAVRTFLALYDNLTSLSWDYSRPDRVKGHVACPSTGQIRHFDFDKTNDFNYVANEIWGVIASVLL